MKSLFFTFCLLSSSLFAGAIKFEQKISAQELYNQIKVTPSIDEEIEINGINTKAQELVDADYTEVKIHEATVKKEIKKVGNINCSKKTYILAGDSSDVEKTAKARGHIAQTTLINSIPVISPKKATLENSYSCQINF